MFQRFNDLAEHTATSVSRRQFLGHLGRGAMTVAAAAAGLLVLARDAQAARQCPPGYRRCKDKFVGVDCCPIPGAGKK